MPPPSEPGTPHGISAAMRVCALLLFSACLPWGPASTCEQTRLYADEDGDGFGDAGVAIDACDAPAGHVADGSDCDDADASVNPSATEICDDLDQDEDCDGSANDDDVEVQGQTVWYLDADGDGYGDDEETWIACATPPSYVNANGDCDDTDPDYNPGAGDPLCGPNAVDMNCDGSTACTLSDVHVVEDVLVWSGPGAVPSAAGDLNSDGFDDAVIGDPAQDVVLFLYGTSSWEQITEVYTDWSPDSSAGSSFAALDDGVALVAAGGSIAAVLVLREFDGSGGWESEAWLVEPEDGTPSVSDPIVSFGGGPVVSLLQYNAGDSGVLDDSYTNDVLQLEAWPEDGESGDITAAACAYDEVTAPVISSCYPSGCLSYRPHIATGDMDGELLVIARTGSNRPGRVEVFRTACDDGGEAEPDVTIDGTLNGDWFGWSVAVLTDDGLAIGAPGDSDDEGAVYLFSATNLEDSSVTTEDEGVVRLGGGTGDELGSAVATGDLTGDGQDDLLIGAPGANRVDVWAGPIRDLTWIGSVTCATCSMFGQTLAKAGDLNGDGFDDFLVASADEIYLLPGGPE